MINSIYKHNLPEFGSVDCELREEAYHLLKFQEFQQVIQIEIQA